ncbi:MAG: AbrB/MazE/SpoVT family DNA-binding domain-containing protein [Pseudomonadota bacterium]|nr:AbrB/MazE/SpoVT family DNA-binding domain-containing protein [Pseudomonadota bacterium]MDP1572659.1 AbrB/MazE/SpoVT family DNA-binding domain-containing protein [Pseudomonadota bacterium]MDP1906532.1 AbrB/MazE/SpoVT family DNA-binding domain-containing protein [Pseudomonadota bacterium]
MRTRVFKSGNSQAVRIPKEMQLPSEVKEVEIEVVPEGVLIRLEPRRLTGLAAKFAALGGPDMFPDGRPDPGEEPERNWAPLARAMP